MEQTQEIHIELQPHRKMIIYLIGEHGTGKSFLAKKLGMYLGNTTSLRVKYYPEPDWIKFEILKENKYGITRNFSSSAYDLQHKIHKYIQKRDIEMEQLLFTTNLDVCITELSRESSLAYTQVYYNNGNINVTERQVINDMKIEYSSLYDRVSIMLFNKPFISTKESEVKSEDFNKQLSNLSSQSVTTYHEMMYIDNKKDEFPAAILQITTLSNLINRMIANAVKMPKENLHKMTFIQ